MKPSEMNVVFVSMKRCGIGWIIHTLSRIHKKMFGNYIKFYGIPLSTTIKQDFIVPEGYSRWKQFKGWSIAYNINPIKMINSGFDRIIVIQRDFDKLVNAYKTFFYKELEIGNLDFWDFKTFNDNYKTVYRRGIFHSKYLKVRLEDLNNNTTDTFNQLMDFLDFPKENRPILIPIAPPERYWQVYSSVLTKGHGHSDHLEDIKKKQKRYREDNRK